MNHASNADPALASPDAWRASARRVGFRGHGVAWHDSGGGGTPLLLIHGFPTASWDWHRVWPSLAARHRLIAPDLLGFGDSDKPRRAPYSIRLQADLCEEVIHAAGVAKFGILAHDYGDTVAQELLARCIDCDGCATRIGRVMFLNGGLFPEAHSPRPVQRLLASPAGPLVAPLIGRRLGGRSIARVFSPTRQPTPSELDQLWSLVAAGGGRRVIPRILNYMEERRVCRERWVGALAASPVPLLLVNGEVDPVAGRRSADRWAELMPRHELVRLPDTGHWPQLENPEAVVVQALAFFAG